MTADLNPFRRLVTGWLAPRLIAVGQDRRPDFVIGGDARTHDVAYLLRWYLIPRNPLFNAYLHLFLRSDDVFQGGDEFVGQTAVGDQYQSYHRISMFPCCRLARHLSIIP